MNIGIMGMSNLRTTPGCSDCDYLTEYDWTCNHLLYTGISRVKIGAKMYPGGGCRTKKEGDSHEY